jgi:hypothetical protein
VLGAMTIHTTSPAAQAQHRRGAARPRRRAAYRPEALEGRSLLSTLSFDSSAEVGVLVGGLRTLEVGYTYWTISASEIPRGAIPAPQLLGPGAVDPGAVVSEVSEPHDTLVNAQPLPVSVARFAMVGTMSATDPMDLYKIEVHSGTRDLQVDFLLGPPSDTPAEAVPSAQLQIFDAAGKELASWVVEPPSGGMMLEFHRVGREAPTDLFVGISPEAPSAPSVPPEGQTSGVGRPPPAVRPPHNQSYLLQLTRQAASADQPAAAPSAPAAVSGGGFIVIPNAPGATAAPSARAEDASPGASAPGGLRLVAMGPLPAIGASASGGLLGPDGPTTSLDRREAAAVDLALVDLDSRGGEADSTTATDEGRSISSAARPDDESPVIELRGSGGFPLIASNFPLRQGRVETPSDAEAEAPPLFASLLDEPAPPPPAEDERRSLGDGDGEVEEPEAPRRIPIRAGVLVAAAIGFGFLLPEFGHVRPGLASRRSGGRESKSQPARV